ncbi:hypothetical protein N7470_005089 [Penicillium chermesinum]|nr:hypothetical protein N7470_005089 [Penicillium chermesinum]
MSSASSTQGEERLPSSKGNDSYYEKSTYENHKENTVYERMSLIEPDEVDALTRIATEQSRKLSISRSATHRLTSVADADPALNPQSPEFNLEKWVNRAMKEVGPERTKKLGVAFRNLNIYGSGSELQYQQTVASFLGAPLRVGELFRKSPSKRILKNFNGLLKSGELLLVLGRPGSGCSTLMKSICGQLDGLEISEDSVIHYNGIPLRRMIKQFKGEVVYNQEVDRHFPHLTVGQTLEHAAAMRTPSNRFEGMTRKEFAKYMAAVMMAVFGLSHTYNTRVGDDFVRGVSGGERKRVSIAEMALSSAPLGAWDNSTRGLDSATALKFVQSLRLLSDFQGSAHAVAAYQASQSIYDTFDKVVVLYQGHQIYFGPAARAKAYFEAQGWECPPRQTTGDFLTSITNPSERRAKPGFESRVPRTAEDFEQAWLNSADYQQLQTEIAEYESQYPVGDDSAVAELQEKKREAQAKHTRPQSPYMLSVPMQIRLDTTRAYQRIWNDIASTMAVVISQIVMALIVGSTFYSAPNTTAGFQSKGAALFFAVLLNALTAMNEINNLYAQRPIIEKHNSYAFYHPATEAISGILADIPVKFALAVAFNIILYFLVGFERKPGNFFLYFLVSFIITFVMSAVFRTLAAVTKTISQAMGLAGVMILALVIYTGFVIPIPSMHPWFSWIRYLNPIFYAFEMLIANEFHGRNFPCAQFVPSYADLSGNSFSCSTTGAVAGQTTVSGDAYIWENYQYTFSHMWRNLGILFAFLVGFMAIYFIACELNSSTTSTAESLVFRRGHEPEYMRRKMQNSTSDVETSEDSSADQAVAEAGAGDEGMGAIEPQTDIFTWNNVCYDIEIKGEPRRLLDHVAGWVKPGTLTALMGVSGAGKTTLLDVLAHRTTMGVVTGDMLVNGRSLDASFQRKTGYVQQQDLHLETATVRESLRFSALLRQPKTVSIQEKYDYVEDVIKMLQMEDFAEAIVGVPGEGLNVEQRKLLTIGVELAARPKLLLFLDEPTSGLDSQSSWSIVSFLRKLAEHGQAVLCTIHQPSAILFQEFDQLLFLARGGKTVYFGEIGEQSRTLLDYFESNGARVCDDEENPAEYMIEVVNQIKNADGVNWFDVWKNSKECQAVQTELERIHRDQQEKVPADVSDVTTRVFQQYWRMPSYVISKWILGVASGLFIGFSFFQAKSSLQGMQTVVYSIFMLCTIFTPPALYEVRERPSKAYSWKAFLLSNVLVEVPYMILTGILVFGSYFYAVVGVPSSLTQGTVLVYSIQFFIYTGTFAQAAIAALPDALTASAVVTLIFAMLLAFHVPRLPFTYWTGGMAAAQVHGRKVVCAARELSVFDPPSGKTCQEYLSKYASSSGGQIINGNATSHCEYCPLSVGDQFLASVNIKYDQIWRNFGLVWVYIVFNIFIVVSTYYLFRVRRWDLDSMKKSFAKFSSKKQ